MVDKGDQLSHPPQWRIEWNLVEILDDDVVVILRQMSAVVALGDEWIRVARAGAMDFDPIEVDAAGSVSP